MIGYYLQQTAHLSRITYFIYFPVFVYSFIYIYHRACWPNGDNVNIIHQQLAVQ